jgi:transposase
MCNILAVTVHAGNTHETKSGINPAKKACEMYRSIKRFCADAGYRGTFQLDLLRECAMGVDISKRIKPVFEIQPVRWVVERTLAWLGHSRRLSKDYEITTASAENMVVISNLHTLLKRF